MRMKKQWPGNLPEIKSSAQAWREFHGLTSGWSKETALTTRCLIYAVELLERLNEPNRRTRSKLKPTAWMVFSANGLRSGKSMQQIAKEWKVRKLRVA